MSYLSTAACAALGIARKLSTSVGTRQGVRVLDTLLDLGWRPGGEG